MDRKGSAFAGGQGAKPSGGFQGGALILPNGLLHSNIAAMTEQDILAAIRFDAGAWFPPSRSSMTPARC